MSTNDELDLDESETPQRSKEQLKQDLIDAERRLQDLKKACKLITKQYRDDIKDCEADIQAIMEQL